MTGDRDRQIEQIVMSALALSGAERAAHLDALCAHDPELRPEVESLLAHEERAQSFLKTPALQAAAWELAAGDSAVLPGRTVGPYRIEPLLGAGGMGEVYRGWDTRLRRAVALKFLLRAYLNDGAAVERFQREARAASALNHPNICMVYDIGELDGRPFIAMEYLEGQTLRAQMGGAALPQRKALECAVHIAEGLAAAHQKGVVHRDLKPENLWVTREGRIKILDFGLAKVAEATGHLQTATESIQTEPGKVMGTVGYMSPEQVRGQNLDHRTDIFSFGAILYEMLEGRRVFQGPSAVDTMSAILNTDLPELVDPALDRVVRRCLEKDPDHRFQTAHDLTFALESLLDPPSREAEMRGGSTAGPRWGWIAAAAALVVMAGVSGWLLRGTSGMNENPLSNAQFTRLTDFEGDESEASISRDGKFAAFFSERDGPTELVISQIGTGNFTKVAHVPLNNIPVKQLGFSPEGSEVWLAGAENVARLRLIPLMGGSPRNFLSDHAISVAWSPDGAHLVYHTFDAGDPMFVADRTGANARQIFVNPNPGGHTHFPTFSLDGRWIYFVAGFPATNEFDLLRIPASGGEGQRLTNHRNDVRYPAPIDSRTVLYVSPDEDGSGPWLWSLDTGSKRSRRISFGLERYTSLAGSGDGRRLVASVANPTANLWSVPILDRVVEERDVQPFPVPTVRALGPRFGAGSLFYLSSRGTADGLWRFTGDRAEEIWKGAEGALLEPTAISPDGRWATVVLRGHAGRRLNLITTDGSEMRSLAEAIDVRGTPTWSPDSKWIFTGGSDSTGTGLFRIAASGGAVERLPARAGFDPVASPDGSLLIYSGIVVGIAPPLLAVHPNGESVDLPAIRVLADGKRYRFLPDGTGVVYMQGSQARQDFWMLDLRSKRTRQLSHLQNPSTMRSFDITPDGKRIVFDRLRQNSDIVLIDLPK